MGVIDAIVCFGYFILLKIVFVFNMHASNDLNKYRNDSHIIIMYQTDLYSISIMARNKIYLLQSENSKMWGNSFIFWEGRDNLQKISIKAILIGFF